MNFSKDLGQTTSIEMIQQFISLPGKFVIDAGCGDMTFSRPLSANGAKVLAIDPDPVQAELNRASVPTLNLEFVETGAEHLPVPDQSVDGVFFSFSLHHIASGAYPRVFREIFRVLRTAGFLIVIEPLPCPLNDVMKLFHDEDQERDAAQEALQRIARPAFKRSETVCYHSFTKYDSFEKFADHYSNRSFNSLYSRVDVERREVREAFERLGGDDHRFQSPKQAMILQNLRDGSVSQ